MISGTNFWDNNLQRKCWKNNYCSILESIKKRGALIQNGLGILAHFWPMFQFCTPWKHQETFGFLVFAGGIKWEHWTEISLEICGFFHLNFSANIFLELFNFSNYCIFPRIMKNKNSVKSMVQSYVL